MPGKVDAGDIGDFLYQENPLFNRQRPERRHRLLQGLGWRRGFEDLAATLAPQCLKQGARDVSHITHLLQHLLQVGAKRRVFFALLEQHLDAAGHDGQRIVEFVHEAGGELAQQGELMRQAGLPAASPRQVTRNRRTTERLPGEVSTRSLGSSRTPVLTSRKRPSSTGGNGGSVSPALRRRRVERTCIPKLQPSTPSTTGEGAACGGAPILRLSAGYRLKASVWCAAAVWNVPAFPSCSHPRPAPRSRGPPAWVRLYCGCRRDTGSRRRCDAPPLRPTAARPARCPGY